MDSKQISLVQDTFKMVVPIQETAADLFYNRLFEIAPSTREMFKGDMKEQGKKLMATIGIAVTSLTNLEAIVPTVQALGVKHVGYGVEDWHYDKVGEALLWTLGQGLGDTFTKEVEAAWTETYITLATVMKDAAAKA